MHGAAVIHAELRLGSAHRETELLADCLRQGWLKVASVDDSKKSALDELKQIVDPGEAEAIFLAEPLDCRFFLMPLSD